jgi:hypothetical protein
VVIVDVSGRRLRSWTGVPAAAGAVELSWDLNDDAGCRVPPGVYLASVRTGGEVLSHRILVVR